MIQMFDQALKLLKSSQKELAMLECRRILLLHQDVPGVLKLCAKIAVQCNGHADAVKWLQRAIRLDGRQADYHFDLATVFLEMDLFDAAIDSLDNVLQINADHIDARLKMGQIYCETGVYQKAIKQFQQAIQADPNQAASYYWLGIAFSKRNLGKKALGCFTQAVNLDPNLAEAHSQLGLLYLRDGNLLMSRDCFYRAVSINGHDWRALSNLCMVLRDMGELNEAMTVGRRAAGLNPDSFQIWHNLGNVYKDLGQFTEAKTHYGKAIVLNPESAVTLVGMGIACYRSGATDPAVNYFQTALTCDSSEGTAISNLLNISMMDCDWEATDHYRKRIQTATMESLHKGQVPSETPFLNITRCDDPGLNFAVARAWSHEISARASGIQKSFRFQHVKKWQSRISIGYLSNNFGNHPTAHITRRLYGLHDKSRFRIFCFSYGPEDNSCYRKAIREGCDRFVDIRHLSNAQAAKHINEHEVNILVDLAGFMKGGRMAIAAFRPAPIQVRWLGMAGTTGADFFDYLLTDKTVTPENQAPYYSEKFVYLPYTYQINDNQPFMTKNEIGRSDFGLPDDAFVFCCFNTSYKIEKSLFIAWLKILRRLPDSVLWLMASSMRMQDNLKKTAAEHGVEPTRLVFADKLPKAQHLNRLTLADLALDTSTVNGAASTSDALWAGVPVLTTYGNHFASRMSSSILQAIGLASLITPDTEAYVELAVQLAEDKRRLCQIKTTLKGNRKTATLFDTERFVVSLERAYERVWQTFLSGGKPAIIEV